MLNQLAFILPTLLLASVIQTSTGFGFGLVAVGIMTLFMPVQEAACLNALPALVLNGTLIWKLRAHLQWIDMRWVAPAITVATPIGVIGLLALDPQVMYGILAAVLGAGILRSIQRSDKSKPWHPMWVGVPIGILSGLLAGAYGTGGPPIIAYIQSYRYELHRHVVCLQLLLAIAGTIRVLSLWTNEALTLEQWMINVLGAMVVPLGASIGIYCLRHFSHVCLHRCILAMLVIIMANCVMRALATS